MLPLYAHPSYSPLRPPSPHRTCSLGMRARRPWSDWRAAAAQQMGKVGYWGGRVYRLHSSSSPALPPSAPPTSPVLPPAAPLTSRVSCGPLECSRWKPCRLVDRLAVLTALRSASVQGGRWHISYKGGGGRGRPWFHPGARPKSTSSTTGLAYTQLDPRSN